MTAGTSARADSSRSDRPGNPQSTRQFVEPRRRSPSTGRTPTRFNRSIANQPMQEPHREQADARAARQPTTHARCPSSQRASVNPGLARVPGRAPTHGAAPRMSAGCDTARARDHRSETPRATLVLVAVDLASLCRRPEPRPSARSTVDLVRRSDDRCLGTADRDRPG